MRAPYNEFEWDKNNSGKNLKLHGISDTEIDQIFENPNIVIPHKEYADRRIVLGMTNGGKFLFLSIQHRTNTKCRPIHARLMEPDEKAIYDKQVKQEE
jgi:uncharacterized DUF497 family protein